LGNQGGVRDRRPHPGAASAARPGQGADRLSPRAVTAVTALLAVELVAAGLTFLAVGAPLAWLIASATLLGLVAAAAGTHATIGHDGWERRATALPPASHRLPLRFRDPGLRPARRPRRQHGAGARCSVRRTSLPPGPGAWRSRCGRAARPGPG
jgi:hypothetical protein